MPTDGVDDLADQGFTITTEDVADTVLDFVPIVGGAKDIYKGIRDGDGWQVAIGAGSIILDIFTAGGASVVKGGIKTGIKAGGRYLAKNSAKQAAKAGTTVLGKNPQYILLAGKLNARRLNIPANIWNKMTPAEQWAANVKFLDRTIARGDIIVLANPVKNINDVSGFFRRELDYLIEKGYRLSKDGTQLIR